MRFAVRNHRERKSLTLTRAHSDSVKVTVTLPLPGKRVVELSDHVCTEYADSIDAYLKSGALVLLDEPSAG